jgi:hypothetical protein
MRRPPVRGSTPAGAGTLPAGVPWRVCIIGMCVRVHGGVIGTWGDSA